MFAFALWETQKQRLTLAVDRFGKKPLYYAQDTEKVIFASEIKALLRFPGISRSLDYQALDQYLANGFVCAPHTIFSSIHRLLPAQIMTISRSGASTFERYWEPSFAQYDQWDRRSIDDCASELRELLIAAVRLRMNSDVPIGAFLSGGLDSTSVVALMTQLSTTPVKTFSIGFRDRHYDESSFAGKAAAHFGSEHHTETIDSEQLNLLLRLIHHFDEPFADSSMIPTYLVSQLARNEVSVVLSGDGGDEVFAGYHQHLYGYRQNVLQTLIPRPFHSTAVKIACLLPSTIKGIPYLISLENSAEQWITSGFFSTQQRYQLYSPDTRSILS